MSHVILYPGLHNRPGRQRCYRNLTSHRRRECPLGAFAHSRKGDVRIKRSLAFGLMSMIGALPGVLLNRLVAGKVLLILFGFLMIAVASISGFVGHLGYGNVNLTIVGLFVLGGLGVSYPVRHCQVEYQNRSFPKRLAGSPSSSPCS